MQIKSLRIKSYKSWAIADTASKEAITRILELYEQLKSGATVLLSFQIGENSFHITVEVLHPIQTAHPHRLVFHITVEVLHLLMRSVREIKIND